MRDALLVEGICRAVPETGPFWDAAIKNWVEAVVLALGEKASPEALLGVLSLDDPMYRRWVECLPDGNTGKVRLVRMGFDGGESRDSLRALLRVPVFNLACGAGSDHT